MLKDGHDAQNGGLIQYALGPGSGGKVAGSASASQRRARNRAAGHPLQLRGGAQHWPLAEGWAGDLDADWEPFRIFSEGDRNRRQAQQVPRIGSAATRRRARSPRARRSSRCADRYAMPSSASSDPAQRRSLRSARRKISPSPAAIALGLHIVGTRDEPADLTSHPRVGGELRDRALAQPARVVGGGRGELDQEVRQTRRQFGDLEFHDPRPALSEGRDGRLCRAFDLRRETLEEVVSAQTDAQAGDAHLQRLRPVGHCAVCAGSSGSGPAIACVSGAASATEAASGPAWSSDQLCGTIPPRPIRPKVGFSPTQPHMLAGMRIEPPVSEPRAAAHSPAATAAPEPPLDPPGDRPSPRGFTVGGVSIPQAYSCIRVLPISTAPASRSRRTAGILVSQGERRARGGRADLRRHVFGQVIVLHGDGEPVQRSAPPPRLDIRMRHLRCRARRSVEMHEGVERAVMRRNAVEIGVEQIDGRQPSCVHRFAQRDQGRLPKLARHAGFSGEKTTAG